MDLLLSLLAVAFAILVGIGFTFWGYRLFLVFLPAIGFFAGFWVGAEATALLLGEGFLATITGWVIGFFLGLILAVFSYAFYHFGVAVLAGVMGAAIVTGILALLGVDGGALVFVLALVAGALVAFLALRYNWQKPFVIFLTVVAGANALIFGLLLLLGRVSMDSSQRAGEAISPVLQDSWLWLIAWIALAGAGIYFQLRHNRVYAFSKEDYVQGWG